MKTSDAKLAELEALLEKATPGEWRLNTDEGHIYSVTPDMELDVVTIYDYKHSDAELACELRNSASDLIADLREARALWEQAERGKTAALVELEAYRKPGVASDFAEAKKWEHRYRETAADEKARAEKAEAERDRLREALRRGIQAVEHNEKGDVRIDGRWTERYCIVSEMRAALAVKP